MLRERAYTHSIIYNVFFFFYEIFTQNVCWKKKVQGIYMYVVIFSEFSMTRLFIRNMKKKKVILNDQIFALIFFIGRLHISQ